jgi:hypothetical protein
MMVDYFVLHWATAQAEGFFGSVSGWQAAEGP